MMHEMKKKPKPTHLLTQGIFIFRDHIGMVREELVFDDAASYTQLAKWIAAQLWQ